jgi:uncharacterized membrane protein YqiK
MSLLPPLLAVAGFIILIGFGFLVMLARFYRKVDQGKALIVNTLAKEPEVTFTGRSVLPVIHRAEVMDMSVKTIELDRRGKEGLICRDNIRADIKVTFFVRVNRNAEDVLKVAQSIGCVRASDQRTLEDLFTAKFSEALKTVGKRLDFESLYEKRDDFKDQIIEVIGKDLNGYVLDDAAIDFLEQTPIESLDKDNILDAQGIRKITEITTHQNVETNKLRQEERKNITEQDVQADEVVFNLERMRADAQAKQTREIETMKAREQAETKKVQSEERLRAEKARIKTEEELAIDEENKMRQIEVAQKNRERVVAVENERVAKDRDLEAISREREVELRRIDKEKALEIERKAIADVIAERISVQKNVATEEENIKDIRATAEAKRNREVIIIGAEAQAQEKLVKDIKAAEAQETVAKFEAKQVLIRAEADLEAADKNAQAMIRLAEGTQAESAAEGLGAVKVKEADAHALEKLGLAEARVTLEKMQAEAAGLEKQGFANAKVKEADALAVEKQGLAQAKITREQLLAQAKGEEETGLAVVRVREADAQVVAQLGQAEALAIQKKLEAEAAGLAQKADAMKQLDGVGREHEEFRLRLDKDKEVELETIRTRMEIARAQAEILQKAFLQAKFNIVGGDGAFFDRFVKAVSIGQSVDGFLDHSDSARKLLQGYLSGESDLPEDLKQILTRPAIDADAVQKLTLSGVLVRLIQQAEGKDKTRLESLLDKARELKVDGVLS